MGFGFLGRLFGRGHCNQQQQCYYPAEQQYYYQQPQYEQTQYYYPQNYTAEQCYYPQQEQYYYSQPAQQYCSQPQTYYPQEYYSSSPCNNYPSVSQFTTPSYPSHPSHKNETPSCNTGCNSSQPTQDYPQQSYQPTPASRNNIEELPPTSPNSNNVNNLTSTSGNPKLPQSTEQWHAAYRNAGITGSAVEEFNRSQYAPLKELRDSGKLSVEDFNNSILYAIEKWGQEHQHQQAPQLGGSPNSNETLPPPISSEGGLQLSPPQNTPEILPNPDVSSSSGSGSSTDVPPIPQGQHSVLKRKPKDNKATIDTLPAPKTGGQEF